MGQEAERRPSRRTVMVGRIIHHQKQGLGRVWVDEQGLENPPKTLAVFPLDLAAADTIRPLVVSAHDM